MESGGVLRFHNSDKECNIPSVQTENLQLVSTVRSYRLPRCRIDDEAFESSIVLLSTPCNALVVDGISACNFCDTATDYTEVIGPKSIRKLLVHDELLFTSIRRKNTNMPVTIGVISSAHLTKLLLSAEYVGNHAQRGDFLSLTPPDMGMEDNVGKPGISRGKNRSSARSANCWRLALERVSNQIQQISESADIAVSIVVRTEVKQRGPQEQITTSSLRMDDITKNVIFHNPSAYISFHFFPVDQYMWKEDLSPGTAVVVFEEDGSLPGWACFFWGIRTNLIIHDNFRRQHESRLSLLRSIFLLGLQLSSGPKAIILVSPHQKGEALDSSFALIRAHQQCTSLTVPGFELLTSDMRGQHVTTTPPAHAKQSEVGFAGYAELF
ncbi:hypothetical protein CLF_104255 [Clonorchis sinensis]|uniref:Uncharacterized protein n=1 Tax=Clonorchis sinensis TaxID=79923 RepID=G7YB90_CLOSI|nr:hypothetical protein CLF_104255 [Clonorchis sinensis]